MNRRDAIGVLAGVGLMGMTHAESQEMSYRTLGKTGEKVSAVGLGGYHIGIPQNASEGIRIVRSAIDKGITFMDNCWDYHDGESERRMGTGARH